MPKYQITMEYLDFQRLEKAKKELQELKKELSDCIEYHHESRPTVDIRKLKNIALKYSDYNYIESDLIEK
ncbi:MAG: hypothetical protein IKU37_08695 [Candidatus Gastranaerophilales bacterium]|nr:hypothetical protein [Candidatus Gastranaerophilales bacterium]